MKIRNGFVSNSSSSSFVIAYEGEDCFERFKDFKGYDRFILDLNATDNENDVVNFFADDFTEHMVNQIIYKRKYDLELIAGKITPELYQEKERLYFNPVGIPKINDFTYDNEIEEKSKCDYRLAQDLMKELEEIKNSEDVEKIYESKIYKKLIDKTIPEAVKHDFKEIKKLHPGIKFKLLEYEDNTDETVYMEDGFMPFLAACPEGKFTIVYQCNH